MGAFGLGALRVSASASGILLYHPETIADRWLPRLIPRRMQMGTAMGLTAIALTYSPWGKRSGAHFNPAITLTLYSLGKVAPWDAVF